MDDERGDTGRVFWLKWMLASVAGAAVGAVMGVVIGVGFGLWFGFFVVGTLYLPLIFIGDLPDGFAGFPIVVIAGFLGMGTFGLVTGVAQGAVLKGVFHWSRSWETSTMVGYALGLVALFLLMVSLKPHTSGLLAGSGQGLVAGALAGSVIGVAQWLVLRKRVSWAHWWVIPSATAGAASVFVGMVVFYGPGLVLAVPAALITLFAAQGGALVWVLRLPVSTAEREAVAPQVDAPRKKSKGFVAQLLREFQNSQGTPYDPPYRHQRRPVKNRKARSG